MSLPAHPRIYHIVHADRLASIIADGCLWSDAEIQERERPGPIIGMSAIKQRRLSNPVKCRPGLNVGDCVPFYFCPRSVMLFVIHRGNHPELDYRGGQDDIVHLVADVHEAVDWAEHHERRWAFSLSNAGSRYFQDRCDLAQLGDIDWNAVEARNWQDCKEGKQAEFLIERSLSWKLIREVGVQSRRVQDRVREVFQDTAYKPDVMLKPDWYY